LEEVFVKKFLLRFVISFILMATANGVLLAQTLPGPGELFKINWNTKKNTIVASIPAEVRLSAFISDEKISYSQFNNSKAITDSTWEYHLNKDGLLYDVVIARTYNLEIAGALSSFKDFFASTASQYATNLGKPDVDNAKEFSEGDSKLMAGTMKWLANAKRSLAANLEIEITVLVSGNLVFYTERCVNTTLQPK
jgi:hypothetical protein